MLSFSTILIWIALAGSTASVALSAAAFVRRREIASALLLDGSLLVWAPLVSQRFVSFDSGAARWLTLAGIALITAYVFFRPWRRVPADHRRLFTTSLGGFVILFPSLFVLRVVLFSMMTPEMNISRGVSGLLDMAQTFFAVTTVLLAAAAYVWLRSGTMDAHEEEAN